MNDVETVCGSGGPGSGDLFYGVACEDVAVAIGENSSFVKGHINNDNLVMVLLETIVFAMG